MQSPITFYGHEHSGHAYKVALALRIGHIDHQYERVDIWAPRESRAPQFLQASRWGEVPCVVSGDRAIVQSAAILLALCELNPKLMGADKYLAQEWLFWEGNRIGMCVPQLLAANKFPDSMGLEDAAQQWLLARYELDCQRLDDYLATAKYLNGSSVSIADIAVFGYLSWHELAGLTVPANIARWLDDIRAHEQYASAERLLA